MEAHEIVGRVHKAFPQVPRRAAMATGKTEELYRSHHREPKTRNAMSSGNCSPVTHIIEYCVLYECAQTGAGQALINEIHASLTAEFMESTKPQADLAEAVLIESCDVNRWLVRFSIDTATPNQLAAFERECAENIDALSAAMARARSMRRQKEAHTNVRAIRR